MDPRHANTDDYGADARHSSADAREGAHYARAPIPEGQHSSGYAAEQLNFSRYPIPAVELSSLYASQPGHFSRSLLPEVQHSSLFAGGLPNYPRNLQPEGQHSSLYTGEPNYPRNPIPEVQHSSVYAAEQPNYPRNPIPEGHQSSVYPGEQVQHYSGGSMPQVQDGTVDESEEARYSKDPTPDATEETPYSKDPTPEERQSSAYAGDEVQQYSKDSLQDGQDTSLDENQEAHNSKTYVPDVQDISVDENEEANNSKDNIPEVQQSPVEESEEARSPKEETNMEDSSTPGPVKLYQHSELAALEEESSEMTGDQNDETETPSKDKHLSTHACSHCGNTFSNKTRLSLHVQRMHFDERKAFTCTVCSKKFGMRTEFRRHMEAHERKSKFPCGFCLKSYTYQHDVLKHERKFHANSDTFTCIFCAHLSESFESALEHKSTQHPYSDVVVEKDDDSKPFRCGLCPKGYARKSDMLRHEKSTHSDDGSWPCVFCEHSSSDFAGALKHKAALHGHQCKQPILARKTPVRRKTVKAHAEKRGRRKKKKVPTATLR